MTKIALARKDDTSKAACAVRLTAALAATGFTRADIASRTGLGAPSITNQAKGDQFPSRDVMVYLYAEHRIDFNFILAGAFAQLPEDVQEKVFGHLAAAK